MEELKFNYIIQTPSGRINHLTFDYASIFNGVAKTILNTENYLIIAKRIFIGRQDKNSKDIFNGDILKTDDGNTYIVEFGSYQFMDTPWATGFFLQGIKGSQGNLPMYDTSDVKIIGNIYETPELI